MKSRQVGRLFLLLALGASAMNLPIYAGTIVGHVAARSAAPTAEGGSAAAYGSKRYKFLEKIDYSNLRDFVVHIDQVESAPATGQGAPTANVTQRDGAF